MNKKIPLIVAVLCIIALTCIAAIVQSGWTSTANPAVARDALDVNSRYDSTNSILQLINESGVGTNWDQRISSTAGTMTFSSNTLQSTGGHAIISGTDGIFSDVGYFGTGMSLATDGSGTLQNGITTLYSDGSIDFAGGILHITPNGFITKDAVGLAKTNVHTVTISPIGIVNGGSIITNAGADYGPDTVVSGTRTVTSGIQEAWNSLFKGTNYGPLIASEAMEFNEGTFFFTNCLYFSNQFTAFVKLKGKGSLASTLVYAGSQFNTNCITFRGGHNTNSGSLDLPLHISVDGITVSALTQTTNTLMLATNFSYFDINDFNFTGWNVRTNQGTGSGVSMLTTAATLEPGLVGLVLRSPSAEHNTTIRNGFFAGLAAGIYVEADHVRGENLKFANISSWTGSGFTNFNLWNSNSVYSVGACITEKSGYDSLWTYCHFYAAENSFAGIGLAHSPMIYGAHFENAGNIVSDNTHAPLLIGPVATSEDMSSFNAYILRTPTSPITGWSNNIYQPTSTNHPYADAYGSWPYVGSGKLDFYVNRANTNLMVLSAENGGLYVPGAFGLGAKWGWSADGSGFVQNNHTIFYADGSIDIGSAHFLPNGAISVLYGNGNGLTNIAPTTGIAGWPANASGYLQNNGSGTLSWSTPSGTLPADTSTASFLTNSASNVKGWYPASAIGSASISDTAYASSWNGVTSIGPSKNAVYDWGHTFDTDDDGKVNVLDVGAGTPKTDVNGVVSVVSAPAAASVYTNDSSGNVGWYPLASLTTGGGSGFWPSNSASATPTVTNFFNGAWSLQSGGTYTRLLFGTNAAQTIISDDVSEFAKGVWVDTSSSGFFFGKVTSSGFGGTTGDLSYGRGQGTSLALTGALSVGGTTTFNELDVTSLYATNAFFLKTNAAAWLDGNGQLAGTNKLVLKQVDYSTNNNPVVPDFSLGVQLFSTNAAFKFLPPANIDTLKVTLQTHVAYVTNTTAAAVAITAPDNVHAVGTMFVTNLTRFTFECYAQKFTNVFAVPIF